MLREQPPFRNVAIIADNDRMYHRIGRVGTPNAPLPQMTGEWRGPCDYPFNAVRLSLSFGKLSRTRSQFRMIKSRSGDDYFCR